MTIQTRVIASVADLEALGPGYDTLIDEAGDAGLFYAAGWLERVWPYYHARAGGTMQFVIAERGGALAGLAPLMVVRQNWLHARRRVLAFA